MTQVFPAFDRFFVMVLGNTKDSHKTFLDHLTISAKCREVNSLNDSDVIIAFVPIVSRAGTDISAALEKIPEGKPVILVVLHHTYDPDYIAPDSRLCVNKEKVFAVDCLYHEDQGLLRCLRNDDANRAVKKHLGIVAVDRNNYRWPFPGVGGVVGGVVGGIVGGVVGGIVGGIVGGVVGGVVGGGVGAVVMKRLSSPRVKYPKDHCTDQNPLI